VAEQKCLQNKNKEDEIISCVCPILTYLKLGDYKLGLLLNFNVSVLKDGIKRVIN
jgi:hypothetical protein